jgi:hypothetical protein
MNHRTRRAGDHACRCRHFFLFLFFPFFSFFFYLDLVNSRSKTNRAERSVQPEARGQGRRPEIAARKGPTMTKLRGRAGGRGRWRVDGDDRQGPARRAAAEMASAGKGDGRQRIGGQSSQQRAGRLALAGVGGGASTPEMGERRRPREMSSLS